MTEHSLLRRQLEIGGFMLLILTAAFVATMLVPRTYLPRYFVAWMLYLFGSAVTEVGGRFGREIEATSYGSALVKLLQASGLFVFGHLVFLGFLSSDWSLFAASAFGVVAALYTLTGELEEERISYR